MFQSQDHLQGATLFLTKITLLKKILFMCISWCAN